MSIDPATNALTATIDLPYSPCGYLDADVNAVWSAGGICADVVARIDLATRRVKQEFEPHPVGLALAFGSVWVAVLRAGNVDRFDPGSARQVGRLSVGGTPVQLARGFGSVWVVDDAGRVLRIEPER